jgi:hypothetical protein
MISGLEKTAGPPGFVVYDHIGLSAGGEGCDSRHRW